MRLKLTSVAATALMVVMSASTVEGQNVVRMGGGSLASEPPTYSLSQGGDGGWNSQSTIMLSRKIYADEEPSVSDGNFLVPGRPIPTNDWWTDIINSRYSGALWSYPAMVNTGSNGVEICYPTYWADLGKEVKSKSSVSVGGVKYTAEATIAQDWHDWDVVFRMPQENGDGNIKVTLAHGMPFTWFEFTDITPVLKFNVRGVDNAVTTEYPYDTKPEIFGEGNGRFGVQFGNEFYGFYFPAGTDYSFNADGELVLSEGTQWLVVALLTDQSDLAGYDAYAVSIPRSTEVAWSYDEARAVVNTEWHVTAENLRTAGGDTRVLQGFLPHAYKHALPGANLSATGQTYLTPRGTMKMYASASGTFGYSYQFTGMLPAYASPKTDDSEANGFDQDIMNELMETYATQGNFGGDTYWGGKGLTQMALNMSFAKQTGNMEMYELSKQRLKESFENWLTYTPGEDNYYLSYFRRWGGILGFAVSYGSDTFNDHHFHYGYFTYAAALLCMEDKEFAEKYGEILTLIAKDYANWDKTDKRFPFLRTLDPWCGHSWAGGLGDAGNDNGNGQESTSESMQAWGGIYLLGVALDNKEMRDAGLFGWNTEARATREYWYDVDAPRPANEGGRKAWAGKNDKQGNYAYTQYIYAYNSNITGKGIGWWTWFGGDPLFMHGIQWMPISPALDYLSWDTDFVAWAYDDMMNGANSTFSHDWFAETTNTGDGSTIEPLAKNDWGNVTLAYLQRTNPEEAARIFKQAWDEGYHIAKSVSTSHISYYTTHNTLTYGVPDTNYHASIPTATVFTKNGQQTFMAYNPGSEDVEVKFYDAKGAVVKTVIAAPGVLTAFDQGDPTATSLEAVSVDGEILPPSASSMISARVLDQYGAGMKSAAITYTLSAGAPAVMNGSTLRINADAVKGSVFTLTVASGDLSKTIEFTVNDKPVPQSSRITGLERKGNEEVLTLEIGSTLEMELYYTDQYGNDTKVEDAKWTYVTTAGVQGTASAKFTPSKPGVYSITGQNNDGTVTAEGRVFITPMLPLISTEATPTSSSEQNAGTLTKSVNDGDVATRWGSEEGKDDEWVYLDLGSDNFISRVGIIWEPAYAAEYQIQVAPSGCEMDDHVGNYFEGTKTVKVPADNAWTTSVTQTQSGHTASEVMTSINATGRYVRMKGVRRGTNYGYSILEMNVYGLDASIGSDDILGVDFALPESMNEGETITLSPVAYTRSGGIKEDLELTWSANKEADFNDNQFTPKDHGQYVITATLSTGNSCSASIFVNESVKLKSLTLTPTETEIVEGNSVKIEYVAYNQFGSIYETSDDDLVVEVLDAEGNPTDDGSYDMATYTFSSDKMGVYTVRFTLAGTSADAIVTVKPVSEANLALNRPATSSSNRGGSTASLAVDGNTGSRWESDWRDGEWIQIDLEDRYLLNRMTIDWDPAYPVEYNILASFDGDNWYEIYYTDECEGGVDEVALSLEQPARYLRLIGLKRATDYGISINEWCVYGSGVFTVENDEAAPEISRFDVSVGDGSISVVAEAVDEAGIVNYVIEILNSADMVMTSKNTCSRSGEPSEVAIGELVSDTYTVRLMVSDVFGNTEVRTKEVKVELVDAKINLALGKPVEASTENGENKASSAVDGDNSTRWESEQKDGQWIQVDLEDSYNVNGIYILWEAAYASRYHIDASVDGEHWRTIYTDEANSALENSIEFAVDEPARYLRIEADERATVYGISIMEWEVYGSSRFDAEDNHTAPEIESFIVTAGDGSISVSAVATDDSGIVSFLLEILNSAGEILVSKSTTDKSGTEASVTLEGLLSDTYTVRLTVSDMYGNSAVKTEDIEVVVKEAKINLALDKPITASSEHNNLVASNANDGKDDTQWESDHNDSEWIQVDLEDSYSLNGMKILWGNDYATSYTIMASFDNEEWREIYNNPSNSGGFDEVTFDNEHPARYLKLIVNERANDFGVFIKEWEVYGSSRFEGENNDQAPEIVKFEVTAGNGLLTIDAEATDPAGTVNYLIDVYDAEKTLLHSFTGSSDSGVGYSTIVYDLAAGVYTVTLKVSDVFGNVSEESENVTTVNIKDIGSNVALEKKAWASSEADGLTADKVTDGNVEGANRWKSVTVADGGEEHWIVVDLGKLYNIHHVKVYWETAYATDYEIHVATECDELTNNGNFVPVFHRTGYVKPSDTPAADRPARVAGVKADDEMNFNPAPARYVMLKTNNLATPWGASLYQLETYGDEIITGIDNVEVDPDSTDDIYYTLSGVRLNVHRLEPGIYIRVRGGHAEKVVIR